jgi:hypothetical protein
MIRILDDMTSALRARTPAAGFGFTERMAGSYKPVGGSLPGGDFHFDVEVDCRAITNPADISGQAKGSLTMAGLCDAAPAEGELEISPFWKRRIRYTLAFTGNDGHRYRFDGKKSIRMTGLLRSWTTLPGTVVRADTGEVVAEVVTRFDLRRDLGNLLRSVRRPA